MIGRLVRFVAGSFPPLPYLLATLLWAGGLTGLAAAADGHTWAPGAGLAGTAATLFVDMLIIRALDDIRDLDYDRRVHPARPLAAGLVRTSDLLTLVAVGAAAILAANAGRGGAWWLLAAQLAYLGGLVFVNARWHWPATDNLLAHLPLNVPVQLLLCAYVYAAYQHDHHRPLTARGLLVVLAVLLALLHVEFARKVPRQVRAPERSYVRDLGLPGAVAVAAATAVLSAACAIAAVGAEARGWLAVVPLAAPALAGWQFRRRRLPRWPTPPTLAYVLSSFAVFVAVGLLTGAAA
ncbi:hypothetical protein [Dactylosporangium sp. NPDC051541]|uniref:hypothetical protein n=1 Tax=Dactylosporangium sp. NPDC051541 TaxID=3363977 RepID=UPI00379F9FA0